MNTATRFNQAWKALQGNFVDNPKRVVVQADQIVRDLLLKRGYSIGDIERCTADISVDHPGVVSNYRAAQAIAARDQRGEANTADLRMAVAHFRVLIDVSLEVRDAKQPVAPSRQAEVQS